MQLKDKHKAIIQDHYRHPRHKESFSEEEQDAVMDNPSCGDRVSLKIIIENEQIQKLSFDGEGCSLCMASASILTDMMIGKTVKEAITTSSEVLDIFNGKVPAEDLEKQGEIGAFQALIEYPVRLKCATLAWETMKQLLEKRLS
ncbi:MAG: SUF system NifU family Fe-S cluster assembly protein [Spirochaetaceae bacterium 4572_59]|nr:MAG: SUF system NifU family Fe-S cluster assembly protein [Spirochaetaceae bacterium 4572_59]